MLSLVHVLEWRTAVNPGAIALTDHQGAQLSYARLAEATDRSAAGFAAAGIRPGDATGKVLRAALRQPFWAGRDRLVS